MTVVSTLRTSSSSKSYSDGKRSKLGRFPSDSVSSIYCLALSRLLDDKRFFGNNGQTRRNSGRNGSVFYWWPPKLQKEKRRLQMNKFRFTINALAIAIFTFAFASLAQAQATRTWVSGVGDDANPCSRTAPCKTFAGAISKTAVNGEIDCLDPGGFGAVTITKSITIDGSGTFASIVVSGGTAIIINANPLDIVV